MRRATTAVILSFLLSHMPVAAQALPAGPGASHDGYDGAIATARVVLERFVAEAALPGLAVAVGMDGRIVWSEGFGFADVENRSGVTPLTKFRIGSVSKALTAAALMTLVESGRLDLDADIRRYVPELPDKGHPITGRQLAGHLGGIRHYREGEGVSYRRYTDVLDALDLFAGDSLLHPPGTKYAYSSYGYNLLSAVIQAAADEDFLSYLRRSVLQPLGMRSTVADHTDLLVPHRARFYRRDDNLLLNARFTDDSYKWASGGLLSTADDLVRFGLGLLEHRILTSESAALMFTTQLTTAGEPTDYGMGWRPRRDWQDRTVLHHGGASEGGRAFLLLYPDAGLVIALLANFNPAPLFEQEAQTLAHFFLEHPRDTLRGAAPDPLRGTHDFATVLQGDSIAGTIELGHSSRRPGWMQWGTGAAIPLVVVDTLHQDEIRIVGAGSQGLLNLWLTFSAGAFQGRWDWLGATTALHGTRRQR